MEADVTIYSGRVKFYNVKAKFGFIILEDGREVYTHKKYLASPILQGMDVKCELMEATRGLVAINVAEIKD